MFVLIEILTTESPSIAIPRRVEESWEIERMMNE